MRTSDWPFVRIAGWLLAEHGVQISAQAVHQFCKRRRISRSRTGVTPEVEVAAAPTARCNPAQGKPKPAFEYDDSAPIDRWTK